MSAALILAARERRQERRDRFRNCTRRIKVFDPHFGRGQAGPVRLAADCTVNAKRIVAHADTRSG